MITPVKYSNLVFATLLNPEPGTVRGSSLLKGLPFVSSVLLKIFESIKTNWERVGNVRFAVTCKPSDNTVFTEDSARLIADEWSKAMRSESVCDFVSVGDVSVKVIGAEIRFPIAMCLLSICLSRLLQNSVCRRFYSAFRGQARSE